MQKVIDGRKYDAATAEAICDVSGRGGTMSRNDFAYEDTQLYRTPRGRYFLAGEGGPLSRWAAPSGNTGRQSGEGLKPIDEEEARRLVEEHAAPSVYVATFGEPEEA